MSTPTPARSGMLVPIATVLLSGLAAGATCCLLALLIRRDPVWPMLPIALAVGAFMRWQRFHGVRGALAAASAMLLCVVYTEYLYAAVRMADMLGFPLRDTFFKMDWRLAWQIAWSHLAAIQCFAFALAVALAAAVPALRLRNSGTA